MMQMIIAKSYSRNYKGLKKLVNPFQNKISNISGLALLHLLIQWIKD